MSDHIPLQMPGGFATAFALGIDDGSGNLALVDESQPLPVHQTAPAAPPALEGTTTGIFVAGPFAPVALSPVFITLGGTWTGTVTVRRSTDGGVTLHKLTAAGSAWGRYSANACEAVWEEGDAEATLWLECKIASGSLAYRLAQ